MSSTSGFLFVLIWVFGFLLAAPFAMLAQKIPFQNFGLANGLKDQNCFDVIEDSVGFVWIGTNSGLVRFDGQVFKSVWKQPFQNAPVLRLENQGDRLVLLIHQSGLFVFEHDSIYQPEAFRRHHEEMTRMGRSVHSMALGNNDVLWVGYHSKASAGKAFFKIHPDNRIEEFQSAENQLTNYHGLLLENGSRVVSSSRYLGHSFTGIAETPKRTYEFEFTKISAGLPSAVSGFQVSAGGLVAIGFQDQLLIIKGNQRRLFQRKEIFQNGCFHFENDSTLWFGTTHGSTFRIVFDLNSLKIKEDVAYENLSQVSGFYQSAKDELWATSLTQGVFHAPKMNMRKHTVQNDLTALCHCGGKLYASAKDGSLLAFEQGNAWDTIHKNAFIVNGLNCADSALLSIGYAPEGIFQTSTIPVRKVRYHGSRKAFGANSNLYISDKSQLRMYDGSHRRSSIKFQQGAINQWVTLTPAHHFSATDGVLRHVQLNNAIANIKTVNTPSPIRHLLGRQGQTAYYSDAAQCLWSIDSLCQPKQLSTGLAFLRDEAAFAFLQGNQLVFYSGNAIMGFEPGQEDGTQSYFERLPCILPAEIKDLSIVGDRFYWLSNGCLYSAFDPLAQGKARLPQVVLALDSTNANTEIKLDYLNNSVSLTYSGFNFSQNPFVNYILSSTNGGRTSTFKLSGHRVFLPDLAVGKHLLTIHANHGLTHEESEAATLLVEIEKPLWLSWWFMTALVLLMVGPLVYMLYQRKMTVIEKERLDQHIAYLRSRAVETQLSPHFIFNALGSIQFLMAKNKKEEADDYLVQFARLLRSVIENSSRHWYPLALEWDLLNTYLSLENLRFKKAISLHLTNNTPYPIERIHIPPLVLQVLVENSLIHGLRRVEESGKVDLVLDLEPNNLIKVCIWDNGTGFKPQPEVERHDKTSKGLSLIAERMKAIAKSEGKPCKLDYGNMDWRGYKAFACIQIPLKLMDQ